jgi:DNA processing protein
MSKLIACLSTEMPWLSFEEFKVLCRAFASGLEPSQFYMCFPPVSPTRKYLESRSDWRTQAETLSQKCEDLKIEILYPGHSSYPTCFFELPDPPLFLSVLGQLPSSEMRGLAIVGSREPSRLTVDWLQDELPLVLKNSALTVISGGARGVDQRAHRAALLAGRPTFVFLPSGLENFYPRELISWRSEVLEAGGAFLSELALQCEMKKHHFIHRNRLIAALARLVFVVEARRKSGSLLTADTALKIGRPLCALPGAPLVTGSQGTTDLLFMGAFPIRDAYDLITLFEISAPRSS